MFALALVLIGGCFASVGNFLVRKNQANNGHFEHYLLADFFVSFFLNLTPKWQNIFQTRVSLPMIFLGALAGILISAMLHLLNCSMKGGRSGLSIAFLNSATVLPAFALYFIFGEGFGFQLKGYAPFGLIAVILGLFIASGSLSVRTKESIALNPDQEDLNSFASRKRWITLAVLSGLCHAVLLFILQYRCLLYKEVPASAWIPFKASQEQDAWFSAGFLGTAFGVQILFILSRKTRKTGAEYLLGALDGVANGLATFLLLQATALADGPFRTILFPAFTVTIVGICSCWSRILFKEPVPWVGIGIALAGVFLALA